MGDRRVPVLFAWNDLLLSLLACLLVMLLLISKPQPKSEKTDDPAGSISVFVFWRDNVDLDIDTHLASPDGEHVFFGHKSGKTWDLLRDDLGTITDPTPRNFENAFARGSAPGRYIVNVAAYRGTSELYPVTVDIEVRISPNPSVSPLVLHRSIILDRTGEEATAFSFILDRTGHVVPGSVNSLFQPLATAK